MIKKRYIFIPLVVLTIGVIVIGVLGYILFSSETSNGPFIFAATEVGTPVGDKVTKDIGPAGGTLGSPDGRLTLTVPPNALTESVSFSIQPITNKSEGGLGLGYRLEPSGKTFTTPLEISVRYNDNDLEGTIPQVLALAYQNQQREWIETEPLNQTSDTLTVATTHFSDWSFLAKMHLEPAKATLGVGKSLYIALVGCSKQVRHPRTRRFMRWMSSDKENAEEDARERAHCNFGTIDNAQGMLIGWYVDVGTITDNDNPVLYTAPSRKPTPNFATVVSPFHVGNDRDGWKKGIFTSQITIVDRGYKVSGSDGPTVYSGTVCSLYGHRDQRAFNLSLSVHPVRRVQRYRHIERDVFWRKVERQWPL